MDKNVSYRKKSYAMSASEDNSLFSAWTQKWGMHVRPWYSMDRLKFSFVEVGKEGKGKSFDICMDIVKYGMPCFRHWAADILSGRFERIMALEAKAGEKYPKAYKYVTGDSGNKSIGICNSQNGGYCFNATLNENKVMTYANVPVSFGDLYLLAEEFEASYSERKEELRRIRKDAEKNLSKYYKEEDLIESAPVKEIEQVIEEITTDVPVFSEPAPVSSVPTSKAETKKVVTSPPEKHNLVAVSKMEKCIKGCFVECIKDGEEITLIFETDICNKTKNMAEFNKQLSLAINNKKTKNQFKFSCFTEIREDGIEYFVKF